MNSILLETFDNASLFSCLINTGPTSLKTSASSANNSISYLDQNKFSCCITFLTSSFSFSCVKNLALEFEIFETSTY